ncbi:MAG: sarcosine oxidase subunit gamma [Rhizobiaceae bacterium]
MADPLDRISPLLAIADPGRFGAEGEPGVGLSDRLCDSLVQVQAWPDTIAQTKAAIKKVTSLAVKTGFQVSSKGETVIMPTGPGRWLIESECSDLEEVLRKAVPFKTGSVTGLTHARVVVTISGEKTEWVLASGIALDFALEAFPVGTAKQGHHHEIGLAIHRTGEKAFEFYVFTSLASAFWGWITRASAEVGYTVS